MARKRSTAKRLSQTVAFSVDPIPETECVFGLNS